LSRRSEREWFQFQSGTEGSVIDMIRVALAFAFSLSTIFVRAQNEKLPANPSFEYQVVRAHELKPHRRTIPTTGVEPGFNQINFRITVSPTGDVLEVHPSIEVDPPSYADRTLKFWPQVEGEVRQWKFSPFEQDGNRVTAEIEEYVDLVPPERPPKKHVTPA